MSSTTVDASAAPKKPGAAGIVPPVPKPAEEEMRKREVDQSSVVQILLQKQTKLAEQIKQKQEGKDEYLAEKDKLRKRIDTFQAQIQQLESERNALMNEINDSAERSRSKRMEAATMKKNVQYASEEEIDAELRRLENSMISSSMPLKDEKEILRHIQELKRLKPLVRSYAALELDSSSTERTTLGPLKERMDDVRKRLAELRDKKKVEMNRMTSLAEERAKAQAPVKDLVDKKQEVTKQLMEEKKKLNSIKIENQKILQDYTAYLKKLRKARREQAEEEQKRKALEDRKAKLKSQLENLELEGDEDPIVQRLNQTVAYVERLIAEGNQEGRDDVISPSCQENTAETRVDGEYARVLPKNQREEEYYLPPARGKKAKRAVRKQGKKNVITHDASIFRDFQELDIEAPLNLAEAAECLKTLQSRKETEQARRLGASERNEEKKQAILSQLQALAKLQQEELSDEVAGCDGE